MQPYKLYKPSNLLNLAVRTATVFLLVLALLLPSILKPTPARAAEYTAVASTDWNTDSTWGGSGHPVAGDIANIPAGKIVTTTSGAAACATLNITEQNNSQNGVTLTNSLTVSGAITISGSSLSNKKSSTITVGSSTLSAGSIDIQGSVKKGATIAVSTGTINCSGNLSFTAGTVPGALTFSGAGTLNLGGNLESGGTFTASTSTVNCNGSSAQTLAGYTYNNLTISNTSNTVTLGDNTNMGGALTVNAGATLGLSTYTLGATTDPTSTTVYCGATTGSTITGSGTLYLGGNVTVTSAGTGTSGATISCPVALVATRTFTVADDGTSATDLTMSGIISTAFGVTKAGDGKMVLSGVNTYTGATTISAGTLSVGTIGDGGVAGNLGQAANAIGNLVMGAGTLQYTGDTASTDRGFTLTAATTSTIEVTTNTLTMSGSSAANTGALTKTGAGTLVFSGAKSYTGLTTVSAGTLTYGASDVLASASVTVSGGTLDMSTFTESASGTLTVSNGATLKIGGTNSLPTFSTGYSFGATSTTEYYGTSQAVGVTTYGNLTINQSSGNATLGGNATVNGVLTLTAGNLAVTDPYELTMGASATTVGAKDVTGIVTRTSFVADTSYTFGNQYSTVNFQSGGAEFPTAVSIKITIGSAPTWKADAIQRTYNFKRTGGSSTFVIWTAHYLDTELNGNTENELVLWITANPSTPGSGFEFGRTNYDTTNNWVSSTSFDISNWSTSFGVKDSTLGDSGLTNATWNGSTSTVWNLPANWTPNGVPSDLSDIVIPDATTTNNDPTLNPVLAVGRMTIESGGILNASTGCTVTVSGGSGAWSDNGTFNASTSTVIFTNAIATVSGTTSFYNVTINPGAGLTMQSNGIMRVSGTMTNNGTWPAAGLDNATVDYNGGSQTVLNPNGVTPGYVHLILSGSGTKTMPGSALNIGGNFSTSGTASVAPANSLTIGGNVSLGSGTTFTGGAYTHNVAGDWTNNVGAGTVTLTGTTINFNGTSAQAIGGDTTTAFNNVTVANTSASVSANTNFSAGGTLTVNSSAILSPAAAVIVSGDGTLTGNGTVNVTRTAATADFSSQYTISNKTLTNLTVAYVGSAAQTVSALTYGGLKINNSNGTTLAGNATVGGTLTLTSGNITTNSDTVIIASGGSVSRTSGHVIGNLQKAIDADGSVSRTFEVGTGANYTPAEITISGVAGSGASGQTLTGSSTSGEHTNISTSGIDSTRMVNRYWTLTNAGTWTFTSYDAKFTFVSGDLDATANTSGFMVRKYTSGAWSSPPGGVTTSSLYTTGIGFTAFSEYAMGDPLWLSYSDSGYSIPSDTFSDYGAIVYMKGTTFTASTSYRIAYYDAGDNGGQWLKNTDTSSNGSGVLTDGSFIPGDYPSATAGTWKSIVSIVSYSPPANYNDYGASDKVTEHSFTVNATALPELPTTLAGITATTLSLAAYYWIRQRRRTQVAG